MKNKPESVDIFNEDDFPISAVRMSIMNGTGVDVEELKTKPIVAVVNSQTEFNPGHMHLSSLASRVKEGILAEGGVPFEINVPAPCDGIAMGHTGMRFVLAQRDLIADIVETHLRSMRFDGMVLIASCDKIVPGMIMAAARLDIATTFITGGPGAMQIRYSACMKGSVDHKSYDNLLDKLNTATCATCCACEIMGTANTFQCLTEAIGLSLPGSSNVPAYHSEKLVFARKAGKRVVQMIAEGISAGDILTKEAVENALVIDLAIGGSTNATLHLPAIAHEIGFNLPLKRFNDFNKKIPTLCSIAPNGPHGVQDLYIAGGIPAVMKMLKEDLHTEALTASGKTIGEIADEAVVKDSIVIPERKNAYQPEGGTVVLTGNLAPDGAVVKQSAVKAEMKIFTGKARVFETEKACLDAISQQIVEDGEVLVIRNVGPKGGPGMPEMLAATMAIELHGYKRVALVTDGRFSGATAGPCVGHVSPEAAVGGIIAVLQDGDDITIDIPNRKIETSVSEEILDQRLANHKLVKPEIPKGYMRRYVKHVSSASKGAVLG